MAKRGIGRRSTAPVDDGLRAEVQALKDDLAARDKRAFESAFGRTAERIQGEYGLTDKQMAMILKDAIEDRVLGWHVPAEKLSRIMDKLVRAEGHKKPESPTTTLTTQLRAKGKMASPKGSGVALPEKEPDVGKMTDDERVEYMLKLANQR